MDGNTESAIARVIWRRTLNTSQDYAQKERQRSNNCGTGECTSGQGETSTVCNSQKPGGQGSSQGHPTSTTLPREEIRTRHTNQPPAKSNGHGSIKKDILRDNPQKTKDTRTPGWRFTQLAEAPTEQYTTRQQPRGNIRTDTAWKKPTQPGEGENDRFTTWHAGPDDQDHLSGVSRSKAYSQHGDVHYDARRPQGCGHGTTSNGGDPNWRTSQPTQGDPPHPCPPATRHVQKHPNFRNNPRSR